MLAQKISSVITYRREEQLDIKATSTYQHHDREYDFPEAVPLFGPPPWTWDLIPEADTKQHGRRRRGRRSGLLVRLRRRAHHAPLLSILLANSLSLDNKVFQRDIRDCDILCFTETWLTRGIGTATWFRHASRRQKQTSLW